MSEHLIVEELRNTALFADNGKAVAEAIRTVFRELNDEKAIGGVNIHLREDDQTKIEIVQFYLRD